MAVTSNISLAIRFYSYFTRRFINSMAGKSRILFVGGTGYIGKFIVEASAKAGHDTFVLVRESTLSNPTKTKLIDTFKSLGVTFVHVCTCHFVQFRDGSGFEVTRCKISLNFQYLCVSFLHCVICFLGNGSW